MATITDKTDYYTLKIADTNKLNKGKAKPLEGGPDQHRLAFGGNYYFPDDSVENHPIKYGDGNFGIQALSIPLKFRQQIGDGSVNPANVETGTMLDFQHFTNSIIIFSILKRSF
ncbi:MAG: hypothetical protein JWR67_32 [Mucilaginibacter sp.]|nr:hypothetical protein [Mucilaginibacter sp.]